jgi:hypothetical protein
MAAAAAAPTLSLADVRYVRADSPTTLKISAKSGESHKILEIYIDSPAADSYMDVIIGNATVARIPIYYNDCLFVAPYSGSIYNWSIIQLIHKIFGEGADFEADQDEDITLQFSSAPGTVHVFYEVGKPGIDKTALLRSGCKNFALFNMITHSAAINATGNYSLNTSVAPVGFPSIADGFIIPSGRRFILKALAFRSASNGNTKTKYAHIWDENYEFFDPLNHAGISVEPAKNVLAVDIKTLDIYSFPDYEVLSGHKLTLNFDASYDGTNAIAAGTAKLFLIGLWVTG